MLTSFIVSMGDSPSLSFLDFLRHAFQHYMGPSPFTDKEKAKAMLQSVYSKPSDDMSSESDLTLEEKRDYIQRFLIAVWKALGYNKCVTNNIFPDDRNNIHLLPRTDVDDARRDRENQGTTFQQSERVSSKVRLDRFGYRHRRTGL